MPKSKLSSGIAAGDRPTDHDNALWRCCMTSKIGKTDAKILNLIIFNLSHIAIYLGEVTWVIISKHVYNSEFF